MEVLYQEEEQTKPEGNPTANQNTAGATLARLS